MDHAPVRGVRLRRGHQRPVPLPAQPGPDRAVGRVRPADPARLRLLTRAGQPEVGRVGVAIDTADDMAAVFDGLPLEDLSVNFTINATAPIILAFYIVAAERRGVDPARLAGTLQNDILKEFLARKLYVFPPQPSLQLTGDVVEYCAARTAALQPDLHHRLPRPRGRLRRHPGDRAHHGLGHRLRGAFHRPRPGVRLVRAAAVLPLLQPAGPVRGGGQGRAARRPCGTTSPRSGSARPEPALGRLRFFSGCSGAR